MVISLTEFVPLWNGCTVSFPNCEDNQCMTLMHRYISEVLGNQDVATCAVPQASELATSYPNYHNAQLFNWTANTPTNVPPVGAIIVWFANANVGIPQGHVAIVLSANVNTFTSFDSNFPTGTNPHEQEHGYVDVAGWLTLK